MKITLSFPSAPIQSREVNESVKGEAIEGQNNVPTTLSNLLLGTFQVF